MSKVHQEEIICPKCQAKGEFDLWESMNVDLDPELRKKVFSDDAFIYTCPNCGHRTGVPYGTLYHDMTHHFMLFFDFFKPDDYDYEPIDIPNLPNQDHYIYRAAFYFHKEIYEAYRKRLIEERIKNGEPAWQIPYDKVRLYKLMNGRWQLAIDVGHMPVKFTLTEEEGRMCNRADDVPKEREALKCRLVKEYVLREETETIADHYQYNKVGIRPEQGKDGFVGTMNFVQQHSALMHRLQSVLSVNATSMGHNREYEVGGRSRWEDIDDERSLKR